MFDMLLVRRVLKRVEEGFCEWESTARSLKVLSILCEREKESPLFFEVALPYPAFLQKRARLSRNPLLWYRVQVACRGFRQERM